MENPAAGFLISACFVSDNDESSLYSDNTSCRESDIGDHISRRNKDIVIYFKGWYKVVKSPLFRQVELTVNWLHGEIDSDFAPKKGKTISGVASWTKHKRVIH